MVDPIRGPVLATQPLVDQAPPVSRSSATPAPAEDRQSRIDMQSHVEKAVEAVLKSLDPPMMGVHERLSILKDDETGEPFHVQQAAQIRAYREAWKEAGHTRSPRISVSRCIFALGLEERNNPAPKVKGPCLWICRCMSERRNEE